MSGFLTEDTTGLSTANPLGFNDSKDPSVNLIFVSKSSGTLVINKASLPGTSSTGVKASRPATSLRTDVSFSTVSNLVALSQATTVPLISCELLELICFISSP